MPILNNARAEQFCQYLARGIPRAEAFAQSGFSPNPANAQTYSRKPHIIERVRELQKEAVEFSAAAHILDKQADAKAKDTDATVEIDVNYIRRKLIAIAEAAHSEGSYAAANGSLKLLGQTIGLFREGKVIGAPGANDDETVRARNKQSAVNINILNNALGGIVFETDDETQTLSIESNSPSPLMPLLENNTLDALLAEQE
jgi:hypothetical protein